MGRYITGDIELKLWYAVQPSNAADQFGCVGEGSEELSYAFYEKDIPNIEKGLDVLWERLTEDWYKRIKKFFDEVDVYSNDIVKEYGFDPEEFNKRLEDYADIELGEDILNCVLENGSCIFEADLQQERLMKEVKG